MYSIKSGISRAARNAAMITAVCATATTLAAAGPAHAQPPRGGARGCPVEDEHGNVTYVAPGTIYLTFHCGTDGQWHWGTLTNDFARPPKGDHPIDTPPPVIAGAPVRVLGQHTVANQ